MLVGLLIDMRPHSINSLNNFISGWYIEDHSVCDDLMLYYNSKECFRGMSGEGVVDLDDKDSFDVSIEDGKDLKIIKYKNCLGDIINNYINQYSYSNSGSPWIIDESPNIQYYPPGAGFHKWHCENNIHNLKILSRNLVFMTYLNDVDDGGETEFYYQNIKIKPERGLTLIWPSGWTHTHRGVPSMTQEKYIITGWFSYIPKTQYNNLINTPI